MKRKGMRRRRKLVLLAVLLIMVGIAVWRIWQTPRSTVLHRQDAWLSSAEPEMVDTLPDNAFTAALPEDTQNDIYRVILTGEAEPVETAALQAALAPRFYALTIRDETRPRRALWEGAEEDTLRGLFLQALKAQYDAAQTEADRRKIALAARCGCAAMDGREAAE